MPRSSSCRSERPVRAEPRSMSSLQTVRMRTAWLAPSCCSSRAGRSRAAGATPLRSSASPSWSRGYVRQERPRRGPLPAVRGHPDRRVRSRRSPGSRRSAAPPRRTPGRRGRRCRSAGTRRRRCGRTARPARAWPRAARRRRREPGVQVVVVVVRDGSTGRAGRRRRPGRRRTRRRWRRPRAAGSVTPGCQSLPRRSTDTLRQTRTAPSGFGDRAVADQAERCGDLRAVLGLQAEHRAVEQRRLVEPVERLGERDVVDVADARTPPARGPAPVRSRSPTASSVSSPAPVRQKNTEVPSGAATAARSASAGPRRRGSTGASSACARAAARPGRPSRAPSAATAAPVRVLVRRSVEELSSTRACPAPTAAPAWTRCWPAWRSPAR